MRSFSLIALLFVVGCTSQPQWIAAPQAPDEVPPANLPVAMRPHNWVDTKGSGSCVVASSIYHLLWQGQDETAAYFRKKYAGGQTANSIREIWRAAHIPFVSELNGDPAYLEWASVTRRGAIIWYFPNHCVHFDGFSVIDGVEYALLNDNNREKNHIRIPKREFLTRWRGYGGFACTALLAPAPRLPHVAYEIMP